MRTHLWRRVAVLRGTWLCGIILVAATPVAAQTSKILKIEEHWELQVGGPDADRSAPQATMVMSPSDNLDSLYFLFTLNHQSDPEYQAGGMQVQLWDGDTAVEAAGSDAGTLDQANDVISWVQRLKVDGGNLTFEVVDGTSSSWGAFGGGSLSLSTPTSLDSLNGYRPAVSIAESQVGYAGNRVQALILKRLVWVTDDGQSHELVAPIDIDTDLDP
jgi:hypothetical protein